MEQQGIILEYVQMKLFNLSLDEDARVWYRTKITHHSIASLRSFHASFNHYYKVLYPVNALFEYCCAYSNDEDILEVDDSTEYVCGAPLLENIYSHQEASSTEQESEEGNILEPPTNPPGFDSA